MELPIPDDWNGEDTCRWSVCWPNSEKWKAILYGLIESPMQGRVWDFSTGNFLNLREQFRPIYDYNFNLKETIMACGDTGIAEGLQAIAISLQNMATAQANSNANASATASASGGDCCAPTIINQGGGVQGRLDLDGGGSVPLFGTEPSIGVPPGEYPTGYTNREEYDLDKCQVANLIIDGLISTLRSLGALSGAETGAALALLIISCVTASIIFPPAAVGIVAAAFGVGTVIFTVLLEAVTYIQDHRQEWVCALYQSNTTDEVIAVIAALIAAMIAALAVPTLVGAALTTIILTLLGTDTLNQLFRLQAHLTYPDADCTCGGCLGSDWSEWSIEFGTLQSINGETILITPQFIASNYYVGILLTFDPFILGSIQFAFTSDMLIPFTLSAYSYTEATPYPGAAEESQVVSYTPPHNVLFEFSSANPVAQVYIEIRPNAAQSYDHIEMSGMCLS